MNTGRKPLMVRGARQVGKTYSIEKFARENYSYLLKVDLEQDRNIHSLFESLRPEQIMNELQYSMPVGRLDYAYMYPLNLSEFLTAAG
ncbi:MAG TPA: AAA family ATPase, partial [Bacteroidales bacterium]|nr:AAA family ATPase [Bacteroidales bacterium]